MKFSDLIQRWVFISSLAVLLAATGYFAYSAVREGHEEAVSLMEQDLPMFDRIQELRAQYSMTESVVYGYYVTGNSAQFAASYSDEIRQIDRTLSEIAQHLPNDPALANIRNADAHLRAHSLELDQVMRADPVDWDRARQVLAEFAPLAKSLNNQSIALTQSVRQRVSLRALVAQERTASTLILVAVLAVLALLASAALFWLNARRLVTLQENQRLETFPLRNPRPVLALDSEGKLRYANPASMELARALFAEDAPERLLPVFGQDELEACKSGGAIWHSEQTATDRTLSVDMHWLSDLREFHVYLADVSERKQAEARLRYLAYHDPLTGLPNRTAFIEHVSLLVGSAAMDASVALLAIDRFQMIVSSAGHVAADLAMKALANRLQQLTDGLTGHAITLYRFDGIYFCWLIREDVKSLLPHLVPVREQMTAGVELDCGEFFVSLSIGIAEMARSPRPIEQLLREANSAMRAVEDQGGNGLQRYDDALDRLQRTRISHESGLRHVLERNELTLLFQPQLSLAGGRIIGAEALLRWQPSNGAAVSPAEFIPIAEQSGLIVPIGDWVLATACARAAEWKAASGLEMTVAVNISARQLTHGNLAEVVRKVLRESGISAECLELEITESAAMRDIDAAIEAMSALRRLGVRLSIDDFGTGYSSLSYLHRFPAHKLKIDQSFVRNMLQGGSDAAITRSVIALAHSLSLLAIAEGVETKEQLQMLMDWDCDEIQGYLLGRPMTSADYLALCHKHDSAAWRSESSKRAKA